MKFQIMIKIFMLLLTKQKVTATELAAKYDISVRSVYRYVEELIVCEIPIDSTRGRYGGLSIADTFKLPAGYFTREEYASAINALTALSAQVEDPSILSALEKLQSRQKADKRELAVCGNIIVDGASWTDNGSFSEKMKCCERAVNECLCLEIDYISREGEHTNRVIDPQVLIFKQNVWYVYAYCHTKKDFRTFKVGRIKNARFTGERFIKKEINKDDIPLNFYYTKEQLIDVTLEINKNAVYDVEEWLGIDSIEPKGDKLTATVSLPDDDWLINKLLSFGGSVKVLSPAPLRDKVKLAAKNIYESN